MSPKTKEILKIAAFIVIPFASALAVVHYVPKIKKWVAKRKNNKPVDKI